MIHFLLFFIQIHRELMPHKYLIGTFFLALSFVAFGQISPIVPSSTSIAGAAVAVQNDWNAFQNPSALGHIDRAEVSIQYENKFMISELSTKSIQAGFNAKYVNIGLAYAYHGYSIYNEMIVGLAMARNFGNKFSIGMQFDYYTAYFAAHDESQYRGTVLGQIGISALLTPKLTVGFHTFNPFQTNIKATYGEKRIPSIFSIGTNYQLADNLRWLTQIDKEASSDFRFASGVEYTMLKAFTVKIGAYGSSFLVPAMGVGVKWNKIQFQLNGELHPILGLNSLAQLKYQF